MQYNPNSRLDPSQMGSRRQAGGMSPGRTRRGGTVAMGGGAGVIILVVALLFGLDPSMLLAGMSASSPRAVSQQGESYEDCLTGADIEQNRKCRYVAYTNSIQAYWTQALPGYTTSQTVTFANQVSTGCGTATSAVGPFYCPADNTVYLDTGFFDGMLSRLGAAGGDAAEAYVIGHEYGHHVQNLTGVLSQVQSAGRQSGPTSPQVRLELQADCYAGVWFAHADADPTGPISGVTSDDLNRAVDAALAVGDDRIQEQTAGKVSPESWTHGSSAQRREWLELGFTSGDPNLCTTFAADALR